jgi:hypothetical protein
MRILKLCSIIILLITSSCNQEPTDFYFKSTTVRGKRNMQTKIKCGNVYYKTINLQVTHESLDSTELSKYRLIIDIDGVVYDGAYKSKFRFEKFELCEDFAYNHSNLIIYMIDEKKGVKYKWNNDALYAFEKYSNFSVKLKYKHTPHAEDDLNSYYIDYN